jgi:hypothetical protein
MQVKWSRRGPLPHLQTSALSALGEKGTNHGSNATIAAGGAPFGAPTPSICLEPLQQARPQKMLRENEIACLLSSSP